MIQRAIEQILFASRWLLAPFYVFLVFALFFLLVQCGQEMLHFASIMRDAKETERATDAEHGAFDPQAE